MTDLEQANLKVQAFKMAIEIRTTPRINWDGRNTHLEKKYDVETLIKEGNAIFKELIK